MCASQVIPLLAGLAVTSDASQGTNPRYDAAFRRGCALSESRITLAGGPPGPVTWFGKWRLRQAVGCFKEALRLEPNSWPAMWFLGKIHQRLGNHPEALDWLRRSHALNPEQPDVAREAGLEALEVGELTAAKAFFEAAMRANPTDHGHQANLALAQLLLGDLPAASASVEASLSIAPDDPISQLLASVVEKVRNGDVPPPRSIVELKRLA
jgi:tetratricopeptide (TPR) repeat protein